MFRIKLSPLWDPSLRYDARIPSYSASHTLCEVTWNIFFLPSNLSTWVNCEPNNNQVVECIRSTCEAGGDRLYGISVVPMICVLVNSIKRVCAWLMIEYWLWGQELLYQLQAVCEEQMSTASTWCSLIHYPEVWCPCNLLSIDVCNFLSSFF